MENTEKNEIRSLFIFEFTKVVMLGTEGFD